MGSLAPASLTSANLLACLLGLNHILLFFLFLFSLHSNYCFICLKYLSQKFILRYISSAGRCNGSCALPTCMGKSSADKRLLRMTLDATEEFNYD